MKRLSVILIAVVLLTPIFVNKADAGIIEIMNGALDKGAPTQCVSLCMDTYDICWETASYLERVKSVFGLDRCLGDFESCVNSCIPSPAK